ncbi:MAG: class I adenylate-forming enzyme family protein [Verrucomicrobiota bacterium]
MLYERWRQVARDFQNEIALHDLATGESWTFKQLASMTESGEQIDAPIIFPQGIAPEFIFSVLRAWRFGKIVCPVEVGHAPPAFAKLPSNCVHLKMTSASTGESRFVAFKGEQLAADAENIVETMKLRCNEPNLGVISLAHSYGFSNLVLPLLLHGIPLALANSSLPETIRRATRKFDSITLPAVPALWRAWLGANVISKNIRLAISAGAPLPLTLEQEIFEKVGIKIHNFYGASECGGIAYDRSETPRKDARFVGQPMKNVQVRVTAKGCLEVRGMAVGETYFPKIDPTLAKGVFQTSDLAEIKKEKVFLSGRASDQINVAGRKVSPEIIEAALLAHPEVADSLVFSVPSEDAERGETIVACVAVQGRVTTEILKQFLLTKIATWKVPREWWIVDSLQTNERGKRSRARWRENYLKNKSKETPDSCRNK